MWWGVDALGGGEGGVFATPATQLSNLKRTLLNHLQVLDLCLAGGLPPLPNNHTSATKPHSAVTVTSSSRARARLGNPVTLFVGGLKPSLFSSLQKLFCTQLSFRLFLC